MNPLLMKYPLDVTSISDTNYVIDEFHDTSKYANVPYRIIVLEQGYFFAHNVRIHDSTGYELLPDIDFQVTGLNPKASQLTGLEVCGIIVIVNPRVTHLIYVSAHMVGGEYCDVSHSISQLAEVLLNDTRPVDWIRLENKPDSYPVNGHLHALWHFYGFETFKEKIDGITDAIMARSVTEVEGLLEELIAQYGVLETQRQADYATLNDHINNTSNPHAVTKSQVSLTLIQNYPIASVSDASTAGSSARTDRYMTPYSTALNIGVNGGNTLNTHVVNTNNPHLTTASQVNAYTNGEFNTILNTLLGTGETAAKSARYAGSTFNELFAYLRQQWIPITDVTTGVFPHASLGYSDELPVGADIDNTLLQGDRKWVLASDVINALGYGDPDTGVTYGKKVIFGNIPYTTASGGSLDPFMAVVATTYDNDIAYPPGTLVLLSIWWEYSLSGNAAGMYARSDNVIPFYKTDVGWIYPTGTPMTANWYQSDASAGNQGTTNP